VVFSPKREDASELYQFQAWNADLELACMGGKSACAHLSAAEMKLVINTLREAQMRNYFTMLYFCRLGVWSTSSFFEGVVMWAESEKSKLCAPDSQNHLKNGRSFVLYDPKLLQRDVSNLKISKNCWLVLNLALALLLIVYKTYVQNTIKIL
jgi:hypothetical protein